MYLGNQKSEQRAVSVGITLLTHFDLFSMCVCPLNSTRLKTRTNLSYVMGYLLFI